MGERVEIYDAGGLVRATDTRTLEDVKGELEAARKKSTDELLRDTDWYVVREVETGKKMPKAVKAEREAIRAASDAAKASIATATDIQALEKTDKIHKLHKADGGKKKGKL